MTILQNLLCCEAPATYEVITAVNTDSPLPDFRNNFL